MKTLIHGLDGSGLTSVGRGAGLMLTVGAGGAHVTWLGLGDLMRMGCGRKWTDMNCPGAIGILIPLDGPGGPGAMNHGWQWTILCPGGNGMMSPGLGGTGMTRNTRTGGIAVTGGNGKTMDGKPLSGSTTRTSETVGLTVSPGTPLNGIRLTSNRAVSPASLPTCDLQVVTSRMQGLKMPLAVASCSSPTAALSDPSSISKTAGG